MPTEQTMQNLTINNVESQEVYNSMLANGQVNENELYLVKGSISTERTVTLLIVSWSNKTQTVAVNGVTANSKIIVSASPTSVIDYGKSTVICTAQAANSLTFTCEKLPTTDLTVNILIMG